mmetsp:Transcript_34415/g.77797  ORF Transcript_34415/g.77797 Transcript_34415/m.77797 type:complete len:204 (-) Transcript_34415:248-859(-)
MRAATRNGSCSVESMCSTWKARQALYSMSHLKTPKIAMGTAMLATRSRMPAPCWPNSLAAGHAVRPMIEMTSAVSPTMVAMLCTVSNASGFSSARTSTEKMRSRFGAMDWSGAFVLDVPLSAFCAFAMPSRRTPKPPFGVDLDFPLAPAFDTATKMLWQANASEAMNRKALGRPMGTTGHFLSVDAFWLCGAFPSASSSFFCS